MTATLTKDVSEELFFQLSSVPKSSKNTQRKYDHLKLRKAVHQNEMKVFRFDEDILHRSLELKNEYIHALNTLQHQEVSDKVLSDIIATDKRVTSQLPGELSIYTLLRGQSVKALYYYRLKDYFSAISYTLQCIALNDYMVFNGAKTHILRIIEQNVNLARVYRSCGDQEKSRSIWGDIFRYLYLGPDHQLFGGALKEEKYWSDMAYLREPYALEWVNMYVFYLIKSGKSSKLEQQEVFYQTFDFLADQLSIKTLDHQVVVTWIKINRLYFQGNEAAFIQEATDFMHSVTNCLYDTLKLYLCCQIKNILLNGKGIVPNWEQHILTLHHIVHQRLLLKQGFVEVF